ncbi:helix-turn-helix domain-containing protein [Myceligenerans indicum]|uniref:Helix-turn-helix transcriptional regulator n=1 Tax=Myceligenerans indicum TaxID=2593663 RepID=A0ABS1LQD3_9MICO|nr:helix-turn-helix transcriptional regulator [Myceligenerans indicum]
MSPQERENRLLLRARDAVERDYAQPLDVPALARIAHVSPSHFTRRFKAAFGETPHRYLQRRRIERAMALLRDTPAPVTDVALLVGFNSLGTFSRTFAGILGVSPSEYRRRVRQVAAPVCFTKSWMRPASRVVSEKHAVVDPP